MLPVLTENFFMDNVSEFKEILMSDEGRDKVAQAHMKAILEIEKIDL